MKNEKTRSRRGGRPPKEPINKRTSEIKVRCLAEEKEKIKFLAKEFGLNISDYVLKKSLNKKVWGNYKELHREIHSIGTEFSHIGTNINQLAKHVNTLEKIGKIEKVSVEHLSSILIDYLRKYEEVRVILRKIVRELTK